MDVGANLVAVELARRTSRERDAVLPPVPGDDRHHRPARGYRVRPSLIWHYAGNDRGGLVIGFANDGIAGVPGVLRVGLRSDDGRIDVAGSLDPGYPLPGRIRQAQLPLPPGTDWRGLRLRAELEVKGVRYPVRWACRQMLEEDGSLRLRRTRGVSS